MAVTSIESNKSGMLLFPQNTLGSAASLTVPLFQEVVLLADFRCEECQKRVADVISRMNGETESVVVSLLEKKVTLTCRYPVLAKAPAKAVVEIYRKRLNKVAMITRLFLSSCT